MCDEIETLTVTLDGGSDGGAQVVVPRGYRVVEIAGRGGQGTVYLAEQVSPGRLVALKVFAGERAGERYERERLVLELRHSVLPVWFDGGVAPGESGYFYVREWFAGVGMDVFFKDSWPGVRAAVRVLREVMEGVAVLHAAGLVHLDLKPGNVLVTPEGEPRLIDFGCAARAGDLAGGRGARGGMAPEQMVLGGAVEREADVYGLGKLLEMVVARGEGREVVGLGRVVRKATERRPGDRYADAGEMARALRRWEGRRRRVVVGLLSGVACVVGMVVFGVLWERGKRSPLALEVTPHLEGYALARQGDFFAQRLMWRRATECYRKADLAHVMSTPTERSEEEAIGFRLMAGVLRVRQGLSFLGTNEVDSASRILQRAEEVLGDPLGDVGMGGVGWYFQVAAAEAARLHAVALMRRGSREAAVEAVERATVAVELTEKLREKAGGDPALVAMEMVAVATQVRALVAAGKAGEGRALAAAHRSRVPVMLEGATRRAESSDVIALLAMYEAAAVAEVALGNHRGALGLRMEGLGKFYERGIASGRKPFTKLGWEMLSWVLHSGRGDAASEPGDGLSKYEEEFAAPLAAGVARRYLEWGSEIGGELPEGRRFDGNFGSGRSIAAFREKPLVDPTLLFPGVPFWRIPRDLWVGREGEVVDDHADEPGLLATMLRKRIREKGVLEKAGDEDWFAFWGNTEPTKIAVSAGEEVVWGLYAMDGKTRLREARGGEAMMNMLESPVVFLRVEGVVGTEWPEGGIAYEVKVTPAVREPVGD